MWLFFCHWVGMVGGGGHLFGYEVGDFVTTTTPPRNTILVALGVRLGRLWCPQLERFSISWNGVGIAGILVVSSVLTF
jgi:hypothetical protein